jgi:hypothetical protein
MQVANGEPVIALDPETNQTYVLLRADLYRRLRDLLEAEVVDPSFYEFEEIESNGP